MPTPPRPPMPILRVAVADARNAPIEPGHVSAMMATHGSVQLRWFVPNATRLQTPHDRDEVYVVASGTSRFWRSGLSAPFTDDNALSVAGEHRITVQGGDVIFVAAGTEHQFEDMSPDFGTWMIFYGPEGGEATLMDIV